MIDQAYIDTVRLLLVMLQDEAKGSEPIAVTGISGASISWINRVIRAILAIVANFYRCDVLPIKKEISGVLTTSIFSNYLLRSALNKLTWGLSNKGEQK